MKVYAGTDPLTAGKSGCGRPEDRTGGQIELRKLLEQTAAGRRPEMNTVAELMDRYAKVADWDLPTRKANEVYIRRVIMDGADTCRSARYADPARLALRTAKALRGSRMYRRAIY